MPKNITTQEMEEAIQVYWELTGKRITKEPNPMDLMKMVHNTLQKYLKKKQSQVKIFT